MERNVTFRVESYKNNWLYSWSEYFNSLQEAREEKKRWLYDKHGELRSRHNRGKTFKIIKIENEVRTVIEEQSFEDIKVKPGNYVRIDGPFGDEIHQVISVPEFKDRVNTKEINILKEDIIKQDESILYLIEEGDYVNGILMKHKPIIEINSVTNQKFIVLDYLNPKVIFEYEITKIVTKQQFEMMQKNNLR